MSNNIAHHFNRQRGAVLIVALVLLLVLTLLGTAGIRDTAMEERMAGNFRDHSAALESAETALRVAEGLLGTTAGYSGMAFDGTDGTYEVIDTSTSVDPLGANYSRSIPTAALTHDGELLVHALPEYYVESLPRYRESMLDDGTRGVNDSAGGDVPCFYRITAKASGISPNTEVILQTTYRRWSCE